MIRPLTCLCMLLAGGAGLTLYQEKHRTSLLDRDITRTIHATEAAHERTGLLKAEWALLNEPGRLQELADRFLVLHPMVPTQFVQLSELTAHLPAPAPASVALPAAAAEGSTDEDAPAGSAAMPQLATRADTQQPAPGEAVRADAAVHVAAIVRPAAVLAVADPVAPAPKPHPVRTARTEPQRDSRPEAATLTTTSTRPQAVASYGGAQAAGYGASRVMAPVMSALATPMAQPPRAVPMVTRAAAVMPVQPQSSYTSSNAVRSSGPAYGASSYRPQPAGLGYSGSSLGTGRASLPPPVPLAAGAQ